MATRLNKDSIKNMLSPGDAAVVLDSNEKFITSCLNKFNTRYKRKTHYTNSLHYVAPKTVFVDDTVTFQYVPLLETLKTLFAEKTFRDMYFNFNQNHVCRKDTYERYCCGRNYNESDFFRSNNNSIQIQIFYDDVQLTCPLKNKPHTVCAIYCIIRNLPAEFTSKLDNMYLVALCDSKIIKQYGCNCIVNPLVRDLKILETDGILFRDEERESYANKHRGRSSSNGEEHVIKGTLVQVSFDNLGGNVLFGFVSCFNANYYCRICFCLKRVCKAKTIEVANTIRTKQHNNDQITKLSQSKKLKPDETCGIKSYSVLNDLNFFHTIDNRSQDIMHDIFEGAMPLALNIFCKHLIEHDIITA